MDVLAFQRTWIDVSRQKERSGYVTHFNDLCEVLGVATPLDADPAGVAEDVILGRLLGLNGERADRGAGR